MIKNTYSVRWDDISGGNICVLCWNRRVCSSTEGIIVYKERRGDELLKEGDLERGSLPNCSRGGVEAGKIP